MSKRYTMLALAASSALFSVPAMADGYPNQTVNRGPAPLQAHQMTPPEPGCYLVEADTWSCPPLPQTAATVYDTGPSYSSSYSASSSYSSGNATGVYDAGYFVSDRAYSEALYNHDHYEGDAYCGGHRAVYSPPPPRPVTYAPAPPVTYARPQNVSYARYERSISLDIGAFNGGVGSGVDGGYYGGGGGFAYASASSSASAFSSAAAAISFSGRFGGGKGKHHKGGCNTCGGGGWKGGGHHGGKGGHGGGKGGH